MEENRLAMAVKQSYDADKSNVRLIVPFKPKT